MLTFVPERQDEEHDGGHEASFLSPENGVVDVGPPSTAVIQTEDIQTLAEEYLLGTPGFLVDIIVNDGSQIRVIVDHDENTSIEFCMGLSRHIEGALDREVHDFSLDVTSPGLDQPLKLHRQYAKNVGREVSVLPLEGAKIEGLLTLVEETHFVIQTREKRRIEGRKAKAWFEEDHTFAYTDVHWTKVSISFNKPRA